jgi:uncharacterized protein YacL
LAETIISRGIFIVLTGACGFLLRPLGLGATTAFLVAALVAVTAVLLEWRIGKLAINRLVGGILGGISGLTVALLVSLCLRQMGGEPARSIQTVEFCALLIFTWVGGAVGLRKGDLINLSATGLLGGETSGDVSLKVLDTSVIIDGRIADIADAGFLDGVIVIPQFVLRELQLVADSSDSMKRNRGRRGLDVLQRIQKLTRVTVRIVEDDFPQIREVDLKLIELSKLHNAKIVTNDFNLNKVAQLRGVEVLNINELANALKPIVLPGETMRVFILKEGKEYNQGVAYLDDGTMVVVDNAKRMISKNVDVIVTSVLQTTAGKMIFGKFDERQHIINGEHKTARKEQPLSEASTAAS